MQYVEGHVSRSDAKVLVVIIQEILLINVKLLFNIVQTVISVLIPMSVNVLARVYCFVMCPVWAGGIGLNVLKSEWSSSLISE